MTSRQKWASDPLPPSLSLNVTFAYPPPSPPNVTNVTIFYQEIHSMSFFNFPKKVGTWLIWLKKISGAPPISLMSLFFSLNT